MRHTSKRAPVDNIDSIITAIAIERDAITRTLAGNPALFDRLLPRLTTVTMALSLAQVERDEIIRDTFYRGRR